MSFLEKEALKAAKPATNIANSQLPTTNVQVLDSTDYAKASKTQDVIETKAAEEIEEDRENLTHFRTWGKPKARDRARKHPYIGLNTKPWSPDRT